MKNSIFPSLLLASTLLLACPASADSLRQNQLTTSEDSTPEGLNKTDWQSIRAAHTAWEHSFMPLEGGRFQARNKAQQWTTLFDGRGFLAKPKDANWQWGLELRSYGFGSNQTTVNSQPTVKADGQRLSYQWNKAVQEWFINDERGLEHGFTLDQRPEGALPGVALDVVLSTRGGLKASVAPDAQTVYFRDTAGAPLVNYTGLKVWDADGQILPSRFLPGPAGGIVLRVEESGARYPLTIDPIAQQAYLKASQVTAGDQFGYSVSVSGDTVVVGAIGEDSSTTGINSTPDEGAPNAGAAYVFVRNPSNNTWSQQAYLKASQVTTNDLFGTSVSVSGDTVVVGAIFEDSSTTGINSTPNEDVTNCGAAYVFVRDPSNNTWSQQAYLKASQVNSEDQFGFSVAVNGDSLVVGAVNEDSSTTGIDNTPNELAIDAGAAYVFVRDPSNNTWTQQAYLKASQVTASDLFGYSVALSGDTVVIAARNEDSSTTGINSTPNEVATNAGAAYVFVRNPSNNTWSQQAYLKASQVTAGDQFGYSVSVSGDTVVVGAIREDSSTTGINSAPDEGAPNAGAAYIFVRNPSNNTWSQQAYLKASQVTTADQFGYSVSVSGDTVVVGANGEDSSTTGINSTPDEATDNAGAAYVFVRSNTTWSQQAYLKASQVTMFDQLGFSVSVSGDTVVVGVVNEDSSTTGINSTPAEGAVDAGAAYIFSGFGPSATVPDAPTIGTATAGNASASVAFTAPSNDGGSAITGYTVTSTPGGITATGSSSPIVVNGLTNGTTYTFTVKATNAMGDSADSAASNSVTPIAAPALTIRGNGILIAPADTTPSADDGTLLGSVVQGGTLVGTYHLFNTGNADLNLTGTPRVELSGPHAADFQVVTVPTATLPQTTGTSVLQIRFQPQTVGVRTAEVRIPSDDPDEPTYTFVIQATATTPPGGIIAFSSDAYKVSQGATEAKLTLVRTAGTAATSVRLTTIDGVAAVQNLNFEPALTSVDYTTVNIVVTFAFNQTSQVVTLPLIPRTGVQPHRHFYVLLSEAPAGTSVSESLGSTAVRILARPRPTVTLTNPAAAATTVNSVSPYTIEGRARDVARAGITRVTVSLNGGTPVEATLGPVTGNARPWSLPITPLAGANSLSVIAYDGNDTPSETTTRSFTFTPRYRLEASLSSLGGVTVRSTPASAAQLLTTTSSLRTYSVQPNTLMTVTAVPNAGQVFSHWITLPAGVSAISSTFTYTMPTTDLPSPVTAAFVPNPFLPAAGQGNEFYGLVRPNVDTNPGLDRLGWLTGTLTPATGAFSGRLLYNGVTRSFATLFMGNGTALFNVSGQMLPTLTLANGDVLSLTYASGRISFQLQRNNVNWSQGELERLAYTATNPIPSILMNRTNRANALTSGFYTLVLPHQTQPVWRNPATYPQGDGFGTITLARSGSFTAAGVLADGSSWTASGGLVSGQKATFFTQLLTPGAAVATGNLTGTFSGTLEFSTTEADSDVTSTDLLWTRESVTERTGVSERALATQLYTPGWPQGIVLYGIGALYQSTSTLQNTLGLSTSAANVGNSEFIVSGGKLFPSVIVNETRIVENIISRIPSTNRTFTLNASASLGTVSGSFTPNWENPAAVNPTFRGILLQKGNAKGGYGFFRSNRLNDLDPEVGRITLGKPNTP